MLTFLSENWPTILICLALVAIVFLAIRKIVRDKKKGGSCSCGCEGCPNSAYCHPKANEEQQK